MRMEICWRRWAREAGVSHVEVIISSGSALTKGKVREKGRVTGDWLGGKTEWWKGGGKGETNGGVVGGFFKGIGEKGKGKGAEGKPGELKGGSGKGFGGWKGNGKGA